MGPPVLKNIISAAVSATLKLFRFYKHFKGIIEQLRLSKGTALGVSDKTERECYHCLVPCTSMLKKQNMSIG